MLIWTNFDNCAIKYLIYYYSVSSWLQKFHFPIEVVLNSLQIQKGLKLVFRSQLLQKISIFFFSCNMT